MSLSPIALLIPPRPAYIGFPVERLLPYREMRMVGPFIFLDRMGPAAFEPGTTDGDVLPHPHIGLATVTWLVSGALVHRDSLGFVQRIEPGDVNWMTAGRGIVHSERIPPDIRDSGIAVEGVQTWVALSLDQEECEPGFSHHTASSIPELRLSGATLRVVAGHAFGATSPAPVLSPTLFVAVDLEPGTSLEIPAEHPERAVYPLSGAVAVDGEDLPAGSLAVIRPGAEPRISSGPAGARLILLGGAPVGQRLVHWNFVSSSRERIEKAKHDWREGRFPEIPGESGRIPLPERV
jgi:redox-sensitive bicupin YhaK (pirin superfamily)